MKANRKFLTGDRDEAVSPVIAVILMVAITVVLAATVYVWVSGFGGSSSTPAKSISLVSASAVAEASEADGDYEKTFTVASASPGLKYEDLRISIGGRTLDWVVGTNPGDDEWTAYAGSTTRAATSLVSAGDTIALEKDGATMVGDTLNIIDLDSNSVIFTLTIGS